MPSTEVTPLFSPTKLGNLSLKNRIVYPAMTRARCVGGVVNDEVAKYYRARATAGLIVTEPSAVCAQGVGYSDMPDLITETSATAWAKVTSAIHAEGGTVVAQLWHTGRMSHSTFHDGAQIVAPSAIRISPNEVPACGVQGADGKWYDHEEPRAMTTAEAEETVAAFGRAAALAKSAGFDGVEVHAASGYLIDTFLQECSNVRDDKYGGDADGRFTFLAEVLSAVSAAFPLGSVGVKLSPNNGFNGMGSAVNFDNFMRVASRLDELGVGYLHVVDGVGTATEATWYGRVDSTGFHHACAPLALSHLRTVFRGALIGNGGYTAETAAARVSSGDATAISFGRVYMANPDLVQRFAGGHPIAPLPPKATWFEPGEATRADLSLGYTEYGVYDPTKRPTLLHMAGSPASTYYEELSLMYARGCASVHDDGEFKFVYCLVHPGSLMSFPTDLSVEAVEAAPRLNVGDGVAKLASLGADVCQSHMFCVTGVSTYRAMLDLLHIPFIGGTVDAMTLTTHKGRSRGVVAQAGVPVADGEVLRPGMRPTLSPPYILKPCSEDNSMGLGVVRHESEIDEKLADAFDFDDEVLCERFVPPGRELRFAVLEDEAGEPTVFLPAVEYFLSKEKPVRTSNDKTHVDENGRPVQFAKPNREIDCALDDVLKAKLVDAVSKAHVALGCRDYSLYDFRVDPEGNIFFLEASLFCCFAPNSVICLMAAATGRPELEPKALFKSMVHRALARKIDPTAAGGQVFGSKVKKANSPAAPTKPMVMSAPVATPVANLMPIA